MSLPFFHTPPLPQVLPVGGSVSDGDETHGQDDPRRVPSSLPGSRHHLTRGGAEDHQHLCQGEKWGGEGRGEVSGEWASKRGLVISTLPVVVSFIWLLRCHSRCHPAWRQAVVSAAGEVCGVSMRCGHFSVVESHMVCGMCVVLEHQTFWGGQRRIGTGVRD